jgi:SNF2 family DNA or RNA helicase
VTEETICPLITDYTRQFGLPDATLEKLYAVRHWDAEIQGPLPFTWPSLLRKHEANGQEIKLRNYQFQMIHHLVRMPRFICGDSVGLGKTLDAIAAATYLKDRFPDIKVIVLAGKSLTKQWEAEFSRFSNMKPRVLQDNFAGKTGYAARLIQFDTFFHSKTVNVMIAKYSSLIGKRQKITGQFDAEGNPVTQGRERLPTEVKELCKILKPHKENIILITDECQKYKSVGGSHRNLVMALQKQCAWVWALTATVIKNDLSEFYSIASAINIRPFGYMGDFEDEFCIFFDQYIGNGRTIRALQGYQNVAKFKAGIRPFYLGRSQKQVKEPLPALTTVYHPVDLNEEQSRLLLEDIPSGAFTLPPSLVKGSDGELYLKERDPDNNMTMLSVYQLIANHPGLLDLTDLKALYSKKLSPKEECLLDLLDGDYRGEKVIVYTKFKRHIDRLERLTKDRNFTDRKFLRITGDENEEQRHENKTLFQDPNSGYDLIVINSAGTEGINLQQAAHMILLDLPWSWGDLIQLVGRMIRMASPHSACMLHVIPAKGTIDEYTIETLKGKKGVFEQILGESHAAGILDDGVNFSLDSGMEQVGTEEEFRKMLYAHVKAIGLSDYLEGDLLTQARNDDKYKMVFEKEKKTRKPKKDDQALLKDWGIL